MANRHCAYAKKTVEKYRPLSNLRVIELAYFSSASYCAKLLADVGAEVIKVEKPKVGDEARREWPFSGGVTDLENSGVFRYLNANKKGITLEVESPKGRQIFKELLRKVDVLVESYPPHTIECIELDYEKVRKVNPQIIVTSITPFGQTGPYRNFKGYTLNAAALGGIASIAGEPDREPLAPPLFVGRYESGLAGAIGTMLALFARKAIGRGQHVDISEADFWATHHVGQLAHSFVFEGRKRVRTGHRAPGLYPYTTLPCKDGSMQMIALQGYQWKSFLEIVGGGEVPHWYTSDPRFRDRRVIAEEYADEMDAKLAPWLMAHTREEIFAACREAHVPFCPVRNLAEVVEDEHLRERGFFVEESDNRRKGTVKFPGAPYRFSGMTLGIESPAPLLGEQNEAVYCGLLGYSKEELQQLDELGII